MDIKNKVPPAFDFKAFKKELQGKTILKVEELPTGFRLVMDDKTLEVEGESCYSVYINLTNKLGSFDYQP